MDPFTPLAMAGLLALAFLLATPSTANFYNDALITWGGPRAQIDSTGQLLSLSLDHTSGSGFESRNSYLYASLDIELKLVPGNSAGTVTTFFLTSEGKGHDEVDFEFLGNVSGQPYTVHTNIYTQGVGNREQQFRLWFDPTADFHKYTILWNQQNIIYLVDNKPIRVFKNYTSRGVAFPNSQPMKMQASLWNADDWATQGGRVKTDWSLSPFKATYRNLRVTGCVANGTWSACNGLPNNQTWQTQGLDANGRKMIRWVQDTHMIYNYCTDVKRFPNGSPRECSLPRF